MRVLVVLCTLLVSGANAATITASSASQADVQTAVTSSSDGDTVLIPNGTVGWATGIATGKQIIIRAENYTPTPAGTAGAGATSRNVTITNNSSSPLFRFTNGNSYHVGIGGIRFNEGTGSGNHVRFVGTGSKVPVVFDCYFQCKQRNGSATDVAIITWAAPGGVFWNSYVSGEGFPGGAGGSGPDGASFYVQTEHKDWTNASTMGALDTTGLINLYIEDSTFYNVGQCPDIEDKGRVVMRYCKFDGAWGLTHGFTGIWGGRHWEVYNSTYDVTDAGRAIAGRYFWCRAGTGLFTDNVVNNHVDPGEWGASTLLNIGDNTNPTGLMGYNPSTGVDTSAGTYPLKRQPGGGHDGDIYEVDPMYIWNNTGSRGSTWSINTSAGPWDTYVVTNRDLFVDQGAKSGYSKYTYPHPVRGTFESTATIPSSSRKIRGIRIRQ